MRWVGVLHPKTIESPLEIHKDGYYSVGVSGESIIGPNTTSVLGFWVEPAANQSY